MKKEILSQNENNYCYIQTAKIGEVILELLKSKKAPNHAEFLPAKATDLHGKKLWNFKEENFNGLGKLLEFENEYFVYLEDREQTIHRIIPISDLTKIQKIKLGEKIFNLGGTSPENLLKMKVRVAGHIGRNYTLTAEEKTLLQEMEKLRQAEILRKQEEINLKEQAKAQRIAEIIGREKITAYPDDGKPRYGIPVIGEEEWAILPDNTAVVVVNNLEEKIPAEAFFVKKSLGGRISKGSLKKVSAKKPTLLAKSESEVAVIEALGMIQVVIDSQVRQVLNFSKENFNRLRAKGLNSGTMVAIGEPRNGKFTIVQVRGNECLTVGEFYTIS